MSGPRVLALLALVLAVPQGCKRSDGAARTSTSCAAVAGGNERTPATEHGPMTFTITSSAFSDGSEIPPKYTCEGEDVSPPLAWSGAPAGTRALALIVDDPDAPDPAHPKTTYVHWVLYDIPASAGSLPEGGGDGSGRSLPPGARRGRNDWGQNRYGGPCPPIGRHRYFFKLYALDATLDSLGDGATKADVERAMQGHVLAQAQVMGTYKKRGAGGGA